MERMKPQHGRQLRSGHPLSNGIVGCWMMNGGPIVMDLSGNRKNGTVSGNVLSYPCKYGPGYDFPGASGDYISTPLNYQTSSFTKGTISVWVNADAIANSNRIWDMQSSTVWALMFYSSKFNYYKAGGGGVDISSTTTVATGQWYNPIVTWDLDNDTCELYVNGVLEASSAAFTTANNGGNLWFGAQSDNTDHLNGKIDHAIAWNRALSASQIMSLYRDPFQVLEGCL